MIPRISSVYSRKRTTADNESLHRFLIESEARIRTDIWKLTRAVTKLESELRQLKAQNQSAA